MADFLDVFIALPGGLRTIEEFFDAVTWAQPGVHSKTCGLLNVRQYSNSLIDFLDLTVGGSLLLEPPFRKGKVIKVGDSGPGARKSR